MLRNTVINARDNTTLVTISIASHHINGEQQSRKVILNTEFSTKGHPGRLKMKNRL